MNGRTTLRTCRSKVTGITTGSPLFGPTYPAPVFGNNMCVSSCTSSLPTASYKRTGWQPNFQQGATSDSPAWHVFDVFAVFSFAKSGDTPGMFYVNQRPSYLPIWSFLAIFVGYSTQFFAPGMISTALARVHENWNVVKTRRSGHFWPFSWAIAHNFWHWR